MALQIIPSIDLRNGQAVRLQRGEFGTETRVAEDPVKTARSFEQQGATRLHVVDLDGSRVGSPQNLPIIREILRKLKIPVQVGGGLRTPELVERVVNAGADRVVIGTSAAIDEANAAEILHRFGDKVIVSAEVKDGSVATHGWTQTTGEDVAVFGRRLVKMGAARFLFTDVSRDGMLEGVNVAGTAAFAEAVGVPVIASGGVAGPEDISALVAAQPSGIEGVIIGKALYAGRLTLADAFRIATGE